MSRNFAICIGINRYNNLKNLSFAVRDAESVRDFCLNEAGFEQVYYFSDVSAPIDAPTGSLQSQPTFGNLDRFLYTRFESPFLSPEDNLWFFFAGHGRREGGRDYLMPLDGSPGRLERTGLAIREVADRLRRSGAGNVVLFLEEA